MTPPSTRRDALQRGLRAGGSLAAVSAFPGLLSGAHAQSAWPSKPIRLIVPFAPGGSSEIVARSTANELGKTLGQSVFVDNKPGASGNIAMQE
ncbi:MAG: tripartite tricarboxylate transporter substrate binding protein, partial [Polaromonas sp.]